MASIKNSIRGLVKLNPFLRCSSFPTKISNRTLIRRYNDPFGEIFRHFDNVTKEMDRTLDRLNSNHYLTPMLTGFVNKNNGVPIETYDEDNKIHKLHVDLSGFKPENLKISIKDNVVKINAKQVDDNQNGFKSERQFTYEYTLPNNVIPDQIKSIHNPNGILTIESPLLQEKSTEIPIEKL